MVLVALTLLVAAFVATIVGLNVAIQSYRVRRRNDDGHLVVARLEVRQGLIGVGAAAAVIAAGLFLQRVHLRGHDIIIPLLCWILGGLEAVVAAGFLESSGRTRRRVPQWRIVETRGRPIGLLNMLRVSATSTLLKRPFDANAYREEPAPEGWTYRGASQAQHWLVHAVLLTGLIIWSIVAINYEVAE